MRFLLPTCLLAAVLACGRAPNRSSRANDSALDSMLARMRPENDSLVRAALAEPGAHLEYRWVTSSDSQAVSGAGVHFDPRSHRWLVLSDSVAFAGSDADTIEVHSSTHGSTVTLKLNMDAGARLLSTTDSHVGDQLGVLLNGHLLVSPAPEIRGPMAGTVPVVTDVDSAVAADLAARLRTAGEGR